jgi:7-carboxy-7-deazaguanine synthase (Cx14CxxC type)
LGGTFSTALELARAISAVWSGDRDDERFVVLTGGEPLLQVDESLVDALHGHGFTIAVETNGTVDAPNGLDWICVSPKADAPLRIVRGNELKVVMPQSGLNLSELEQMAFTYYFVQPMDGPDLKSNTQWAVHWCLQHPRWRLSLQTHKLLGIR